MKNKYFNKKTGGFDSKKEAKIYQDLYYREKAGEITNLEKQKTFVLFDSFKDNQGKTERGCKYTPDFYYIEKGVEYAIEVKSSYTAKLDDYVIRRKLFKLKYPNIVFVEVVK